METTFATRVKQFREHKGLAQAAFAERCGLTQGNVSQMEQGTEPKQSNISKLLLGHPDLNPGWLLTGDGPMLRDGRALTPFVPGGEVNKFGATVVPKGGLAHALGAGFGEDIDQPHGAPQAAPAPKNRMEFIESILRENKELREREKQTASENSKLYEVIRELQATNRTSQEQINTLLGKPSGSQYAPGVTYDEFDPQPRTRAGLRFYDEPATVEAEAAQECVMRSIFSAPVVREFVPVLAAA